MAGRRVEPRLVRTSKCQLLIRCNIIVMQFTEEQHKIQKFLSPDLSASRIASYHCHPSQQQQDRHDKENKDYFIPKEFAFSHSETPPFSQSDSECYSELDSQDSVASIEDNILEQHVFCSEFLFQKLETNIFKHFETQVLTSLQEKSIASAELDVWEYLELHPNLMASENCSLLKRILSQQRNLKAFFEWVYDASPQFYLRDLVIILQRTILLYHRSFQPLALSLPEILRVVSRPEFLFSAYGGQDIELLRFSRFLGGSEPTREEDSAGVQQFMKGFVLTVVLVMQNCYVNPLQQKIRERKKKELDRRFKQRIKMMGLSQEGRKNGRSRKIKKRRPQKC